MQQQREIIILFLFLACYLCIAISSCTGVISQDEFGALQALYDSTGGDKWRWVRSEPPSTIWTFPNSLTTPCTQQWQGLSCVSNIHNDSECYLVALNLFDYQLNGTIPSAMTYCTRLEQLNLANNQLFGTVPTELGQMSALQELNLYDNSIEGSIPIEFGQFTAMEVLSMHTNLIHGTIATELGLLLGMQILSLYGNSLFGSIPTELCRLKSLQQLLLDSNSLIGMIPTELGLLLTLQQLYLNSNCLVGTIPTEFGQLQNLQIIALDRNRLVGSIPTELGRLLAMQQLYLHDNNLDGSIPIVLGKLINMQLLYVESNSLTGPIPTELGQLSALEELYLYSNRLVGTIPTEFGQLIAMQQLYLNSNRLNGSIPTEIGQLTSMQRWSLYSNSLVGSIPTEIGQLSAMQILDLYSNMLAGTIPTEFGNLSSMQILDLYNNHLVGLIPTEIGLLSSLQIMDFNNNSLSGCVPTEFGRLWMAQIIDLNTNALFGAIPSELGHLSAILELNLHHNYLNDQLPSELGLLSVIQQLDLSDNRLTGSIPSEFGLLLELQILSLGYNSLEGLIPAEFGQLLSMQMCQIQFNSLSGTIPSLVAMKSLQAFNVSTNRLSGTVSSFPASVQYVGLSSNYFSSSIATAFAAADRINYLDISDNALTGPIPSYFADWRLLESLNVSINLLSQSIESLIFRGDNSSIQSLDASNNLFSGSLSGSFFLQRSLHTVLLFENCFSGSLPSALCDNSRLRTLFLDSLTGNCGSAVPVGLRSVIHASIPKRLMQGGIPSCVWSMGELQLLRLSGNGLTGSLGAIPTNSSLSVMVLSSNALTGSIPSSWQSSGQWSQLDLSSNKLSGLLSDDFAISSDSTLLDLTVNRLSGRLPAVFENVSHPLSVLDGNLFQCQASHLPEQDPDHNGYVCGADDLDTALEFAIGVVGLAVIYLCAIWYRGGWLHRALTEDVRVLFVLRMDAAHLMSVACLQAVVTVVLYSSFKMVDSLQTFSTHSVQYTWTPSVAFLHGWGPVLLVCLLLLVTGLLWQINIGPSTVSKPSGCNCQWQWPQGGIRSIFRKRFQYGSVHVLNVVVVVAVNAAYVNAVLAGLSTSNLFAIQFLLSVFKLVWNLLIVPYLSVVGGCETSDRLFMTLFAFIGGPFISTFFTSSNCFRNLYIGESSAQSTASIPEYSCNDFCSTDCLYANCDTVCYFTCGFAGKLTLALSFTPPWTYSYQCASSLLTNYIPVMIVTFAISGAVQPLLTFIYYSMHPSMVMHVTRMLPSRVVKSVMHGSLYAANREQVVQMKEGKEIIKSSKLRLQHLLHVSILLTFGIASPLLSVLIGIGAAMQCARWHVGVGRILDLLQTQDTGGSDDWKSSEVSKSLVLRELASCEIRKQSIEMRIVMLFAGLFWGFFVFDMMGDVYGSVVGGLSVLAPCGVSLLVVLVGENFVVSKLFFTTIVSESLRQSTVDIELEMVSVNPIAINMTVSTEDDFSPRKDSINE